MVRAGRMSYFLTESGRRLVFYGSTTLAVGIFSGHYLTHTIGIQYYKNLFQAYKNGEERQVSEKLLQRFERAVNLLNLSDFERKFVNPFMVSGFDVCNAGTLKSRNGGLVGIPVNFEYDHVNDIDKKDVIIRGHKVDWSSEGGKLLEGCLVLSEDEQVFGMAREIVTMNTNKRLFQAIIPTTGWVFTYSIASLINQRMNLYVRPRSLRMVLYTICGLFGYGIYSFAADMSEMYYETDADKKLAALGPQIADAGVRFYNKILQKNVAIRKLTGDDYYTAKGNINYLVRQKAAPLTMRRDFFIASLSDLTNDRSEEAS
ncbi:transmembrane protein 177 [Uranotaenia lowii]|uniref:transmembrane protein 177 n=1 Tax=Uranotaenia lowii TaxID=190385 RepID=UPI002479A4B0|nr:transmembrane protein 177 [Uranotaenia lowii]